MPRHNGGGGLLQRFISEQPVRHVGQRGELHHRPAAQTNGLDKSGGSLPEPLAERGHVSQQARVGELESGHFSQRLGPRRTGQVVDIGASEAQDGLTPVIITL
jgi:hypothetical protein